MKIHHRRHQRHRNPAPSEQKQTPFFNAAPQAVQTKQEPFFQTNLSVGQPNDPYEQEADAMADQVVSTSAVQTAAPTIQASLQKNEEKKPGIQMQSMPEKDQEEKLQMKALPEEREKIQMKADSATANNSTSLSSQLSTGKGAGQPLSSGIRTGMEAGFGADFSKVSIHTDDEAVEMNQQLHAQAFTHGNDVYFNRGKYMPDTSSGKHLLAHELTHTLQQNKETVKKKDKTGGSTEAAGSSAEAGPVGIKDGESTTPSNLNKMAEGYVPAEDGNYLAPDGRVITEAQARAESNVINSEGIFMIAYLGRYNALSDYPSANKEELSAKAGFMKQFSTGDIVLRMMKAADSAGIAKVTNSNYSHSGIIQVKGGRVWVLDSYPGRIKEGVEDSTQLVKFEDFFSSQHGEQIIQGLVLKIRGIDDAIRNQINEIIKKYDSANTSFDKEFRIDDNEYVLYCSELVWRILKEARAPGMPGNEYDETLVRVESELVPMLNTIIAIKQSQGIDTSQDQSSLNTLAFYLSSFKNQPFKELYSPGSLEHDPGLETVAGFRSNGIIDGRFDIIAHSAEVPDDMLDTPDNYLVYGGSETSVKDDTTKPVWNEKIGNERYESLQGIAIRLYDKDPLSFDDLLATFIGDLRPVRPDGQIFSLSDSGATLNVEVKSDGTNAQAQAPRDIK